MKTTPGSPSRRRIEAVRRLLGELRRTAEEGDPLAGHLRRLVEETGDPGAELAWLAAYDHDEPVQADAMILLIAAGDDPNVPGDVRRRIAGSTTLSGRETPLVCSPAAGRVRQTPAAALRRP